MGEDSSTEWPDDTEPLFGEPKSEQTVENPAKDVEFSLDKGEVDTVVETETETDTMTDEPVQEPPLAPENQWALPVRAAPLLEQFHDEQVTEYPLQQSTDGRKSTSLVLDDDLLRIIETRLDSDGQRRMSISLSMKRKLTGFKHDHNELMHKHQFLWLGAVVLGGVFLLTGILVFTLLGLVCVSAGLWNWTKMHLETHRLEFANSGGVLRYTLRGYGTDRPFFRASMAYLGSEMANLLRTGRLETSAVEELHATLAAPPQPKPSTVVVPIPQTVQHQSVGQPLAPSPLVATAPEKQPLPSPQSTLEPMAGPPVIQPLPPAPIPPPQNIPPPPQNIPSTPMVGPPATTPLPSPPLPLPTPPPPMNGGGMTLPPPLGLPGAPIPLDAPMPNAPEVAVTASPVEDTLSKEEQKDLLNELS